MRQQSLGGLPVYVQAQRAFDVNRWFGSGAAAAIANGAELEKVVRGKGRPAAEPALSGLGRGKYSRAT